MMNSQVVYKGNGRYNLQKIRLQVKLSSENSKKEQMFLIYNYLKETNECIEITVRKFLQIEHLVQDMYEKYGGHVIPVLDMNNSFRLKQAPQHSLILIGDYLNDLVRNAHTSRDPKLYEFLLQQQVHFPNIQRYDKVLSDAAVLSRRYLNSIFTRKDNQPTQPEFEGFLHTHRLLVTTTSNYNELARLVEITTQQQEVIEDIFGAFREIRGGLGFGIQPVEFATLKIRKNMRRFGKILHQAEEAFVRWEVLNETVRQLQCNLYKGMHEDNAYYESKAKQLKQWSRTLEFDFLQVVKKGDQLMESIGKHLLNKKSEQYSLFDLSRLQQANVKSI